MSNKIRISKFLSMVLRHKPHRIGIQLDENGWADVSSIIAGLGKNGYRVNMSMLEEIVATCDKKRFSFNEDKTKIRANQGHSIDIDLGLDAVQPPHVLYHGTAQSSTKSILKQGLLKRKRHHVHLSLDRETALAVGRRHGIPVILVIDSRAMHQDGYSFYVSDNGVWLTDEVPVRYISELADKKSR